VIPETEQLSEAVAEYVTALAQAPEAMYCVEIVGQVIVGAMLSVTVTVKEQVAVLPVPSVALAVTVVVPRPKVLPEAGE
jgi:uncharacterized protein (DUF983 family)